MIEDNMYGFINNGDLENIKELFQPQGTDKNSPKDISLLYFSVIKNQYKVTQYFLEQGCDPNRQTEYGIFPLQVARSIEMAELLIKHAADVKATSSRDKRNVLHSTVLAENDSAKLTDYFVKQGAEINGIDKHGKNPLMTLLEYRCVQFGAMYV